MHHHIDKKSDLQLLWDSFLAGDDGAFSGLYEEFVRNLFSFGTTFTQDTELIKDCIQDVFIRLYNNRNNLGEVKNPKSYMLTALKNSLINEFDKRQTYRKFADAYGSGVDTEGSDTETAISKTIDTGAQGMITDFKSFLTMRQQEIIHYRFVEELSIEEISELLSINYQSVANIIQRSLKKIRKFYLKG